MAEGWSKHQIVAKKGLECQQNKVSTQRTQHMTE